MDPGRYTNLLRTKVDIHILMCPPPWPMAELGLKMVQIGYGTEVKSHAEAAASGESSNSGSGPGKIDFLIRIDLFRGRVDLRQLRVDTSVRAPSGRRPSSPGPLKSNV